MHLHSVEPSRLVRSGSRGEWRSILLEREGTLQLALLPRRPPYVAMYQWLLQVSRTVPDRSP